MVIRFVKARISRAAESTACDSLAWLSRSAAVGAAVADGLAIQLDRLRGTTPLAAELRVVRAVPTHGRGRDMSQRPTIVPLPHIPFGRGQKSPIPTRTYWLFDVHSVLNVQTRGHTVFYRFTSSGPYPNPPFRSGNSQRHCTALASRGVNADLDVLAESRQEVD
jgi:hypothetical protein